jgi:hypothetical protein
MTTKSQPVAPNQNPTLNQSAPAIANEASNSNSMSNNNNTNTQSNSRLDTINEDHSNEDKISAMNKTYTRSLNHGSQGNQTPNQPTTPIGNKDGEFDPTKEL